MVARLILAALVTTTAATAATAAAAALSHNNSPVDDAFAHFKSHFNKSYVNDVDERRARNVFEGSMKVVAEHNASDSSFSMTLNEFSDMSPEEFKSSRVCSGGRRPTVSSSSGGAVGKSLGTKVYSGVALPKSVDWVAKGAVTGAKNQGDCGSCWSFSATGALEGAWFIAGHGLISLAEQEFVDCDDVDQGCEGGEMDVAFKFAAAHGVCTEKSYPYLAFRSAECNKTSCRVGIPRGSVVGFHDVAHNEEAMMEAVAQQPISIGIEADQASFQLYGSGIITTGCGDQLDHGVLLVGYGTLNGSKYWKVKNSWGPSWGMNGYVLIARGGVKGQGECGIRGDPSFPVVKMAEIVA